MTGDTDCHDQNDAADRDISNPYLYRLRPLKIEEEFFKVILDLRRVVVLDGVDIFDDPPAFRIRSHDLHGPLPELLIKNSGDTFEDKEQLGNETCKLVAISSLRNMMVRCLPGCRLMPPTRMDGVAVVGLRASPYTWLAEGKDWLPAGNKVAVDKLDQVAPVSDAKEA